MNRLKRIIALCLSVSLISAMVVFAESELPKTINDEISVSLLNALDITDYTSSSKNKEVTRGEFAELIVRMMGYSSEMIEGYNAKVYFTDVATNDKYFNSIGIAAEQGWLTGYENGRYYPEGKIKSEHAVYVMLRCLGYGELIGTPGIAAASSDITDGVNMNQNLDLYSCFELMVNALQTDILAVEYTGAKSVEYTENSENLLWKLYSVYKTDGIINANDTCALYGYNAQVENNVLLGENEYNVGQTDISDYIGHFAEAFVRSDYDDEDYGTIVEFSVKKKNEIVSIDAKDISAKTTDKSVVYYEGQKEKRVDISFVDLIYNNELLVSYDGNDLKIQNGTITVIDNDRDGNFDVAVVRAYTNHVVRNVSSIMETIDFLYGQSEIDFSDEKYVLTDVDGIELAFSSLKKYDVLAVYESKSGTAKKIFIEKSDVEAVSGTITSVRPAENASVYAEINGTEYLVDNSYYAYSLANPDIAPIPEPGLESVFYLDINGKIAAISDEIQDGLYYGYMTKIYTYDENVKEELFIKVFDENGMYSTLSADKNIKYNGVKQSYAAIMLKPELYKTYEDGSIKVKPQLIKYKVNNGLVTELYVAQDGGELTVVNNGTPVEYVSRATGKILAVKDKTFEKYFYDNKTPVFSVPADDGTTPEADEMFVYSSDVIKGDTHYWMTFYDVDKTGKIGVVLMSEAAEPSWERSQNVMVVEDISYGINSEDVAVQKISGMHQSGAVMEFDIPSDEDMIANANIQKGDIVVVIADSKGEIQSIRKLFTTKTRAQDIENDYNYKNHVAYAGTYTVQQAMVRGGADTINDYFAFGSVYGITCGKTDTHIVVDTHSKDDDGREYAPHTYPLANWHTPNVFFIDYRNNNVSVYIGSYADVKETGDEVFSVIYHYRPGAIYVIKR